MLAIISFGLYAFMIKLLKEILCCLVAEVDATLVLCPLKTLLSILQFLCEHQPSGDGVSGNRFPRLLKTHKSLVAVRCISC